MLLQLAILYFWAAVSKMNAAWIDGRTLSMQMRGPVASLITSTVGWAAAAKVVILVELTIAATIWHRRGWWIAAPLGLALHLGIAKTDLEIGLFSWLMIALYALVIPDRVWLWLADGPVLVRIRLGGAEIRLPIRALRRAAGKLRELTRGSLRFAVWIVGAAAGAVLAMMSRFADGPAVGLALVIVLLIGTVYAVWKRSTSIAWLACAHLLAFGLWTAVDRTTTTASDYYRFWGGSARRLGDAKTAEDAYRQMTEVAPDEPQGFYQLGRLLLARGAGDDGLAALHRAQDLEPLRARSYVAEARWLAAHGKRDEAIGKAREATIVEPGDAEAKALLDSLLGGQ
jgi:hypothetical protein